MIGPSLPPWQPASNGTGKRHWFLYRSDDTPFRHRWLLNARGDLIRYASCESAWRAAGRLNAQTRRPS